MDVCARHTANGTAITSEAISISAVNRHAAFTVSRLRMGRMAE